MFFYQCSLFLPCFIQLFRAVYILQSYVHKSNTKFPLYFFFRLKDKIQCFSHPSAVTLHGRQKENHPFFIADFLELIRK